MNKNEISVFQKRDFLEGTKPFEEVYKYMDDRFELDRAVERMSDLAKVVGVRNFKKLFKSYCDARKRSENPDYVENSSDFDGQEIELNTGRWAADDSGITRESAFGMDIACVHPLLPVQRLVNIDSGIEKLKIAYRKGKNWRYIISDRQQLASANRIVGLSDYGVAVTSETARYLVQYIHDVENLNYEKIPENKSVGRLGWIGQEGFSPYVDNLTFDGDLSFKHFFDAVSQKGSFEEWLKLCRDIRKGNIYARIILAASFASVLVEPCGALPFFVHLWGGTGTGKTVGLLLAASVWANPEMGRYIHTFNSTAVAQELSAGFVNSLPLIIDELQIQRDKSDFDNIIYQLAEGVGKNRGAKTGGLQQIQTWNNCILTTGEQPISSNYSGSGAINRIIELSCEEIRLFNDPIKTADLVKKNYGFAGKMFVEKLQDPKVMEQAKETQKRVYKQLSNGDTTEKQALSASLILTADILSELFIFKDKVYINMNDIAQFLATKSDASQNERAFEWIMEWIAQYSIRFAENSELKLDRWGKFEGEDTVCIIRSVFDRACRDNGFNSKSFLTWLRSKNMIEVSGKGFTKSKRIDGVPCNCIVLNMEGKSSIFDDDKRETLDF